MPIQADDAHVMIYFQITDMEKYDLQCKFALESYDIDAIFDSDEVPRVENTPEGAFIIWKRPDNVSFGAALQFEVSSIGIVIKPNCVAFILPDGELSMSGREFKRIKSTWDYVLSVLLHIIHHYQGHLKAIKMMSQELQAKLISSMENKYFLQIFTLGESLVYYHNSLEANLAVLYKLRATSEKLGFTREQITFLEDVIIENQQASKQAKIYSMVLSGLMDARGTIINNNVNVLLKNLTIINIVFLPLNLLASIGGMSEYSMMTHDIDWRISYGLFLLGMTFFGWVIWRWLVKIFDHKQ